MHGTKDRTTELGATTGHTSAGRGRALTGGALALALLAGGATAAALSGGLDGGSRRVAVTSDAPAAGQDTAAQDPAVQQPAAQEPDVQQPAAQAPDGTVRTAADPAPEQEPDAPAAKTAADRVPAGTHGVHVLAQGWDERGRYVVLDRGRLTDGPAAEPGVDGTRPVLFDTGAVVERRRVDLADAHSLRFSRYGGEPSYGSGNWADFVTEISGRDAGMLATVRVDADGELASLEEPYRP